MRLLSAAGGGGTKRQSSVAIIHPPLGQGIMDALFLLEKPSVLSVAAAKADSSLPPGVAQLSEQERLIFPSPSLLHCAKSDRL